MHCARRGDVEHPVVDFGAVIYGRDLRDEYFVEFQTFCHVRRGDYHAVGKGGTAAGQEKNVAGDIMVGSALSGLVMKNLDIDFHIYTDEPMLEKSLAPRRFATYSGHSEQVCKPLGSVMIHAFVNIDSKNATPTQ